ncbi:MAG: hypothetical protein JST20_10415 [Bacteroidetes bacterium]|nr:hypothetical protein [Bacteroidota bacterium]
MKNKIITLLAVFTAIVFGSVSVYSQTGCPTSPVPDPPGSLNCQWQLNVTTFFDMLMPDGTLCNASLIFCERCCDGNSEFYLQSLSLPKACVDRQGVGFSLYQKSIQDQVRSHMFRNSCSDNPPAYPPCPDQSVSYVYEHKSPCYNVQYVYTLNGLMTVLSSCIAEIGCTKRYTVCFDGTKNIYTFADNPYSVSCPTNTNGCFGICNEQP